MSLTDAAPVADETRAPPAAAGSAAACDLCGGLASYPCRPENKLRFQTSVCASCGLIFASPAPTPDELDLFNMNNPGEQGSPKRNPSGLLSEKDLGEEEFCTGWALPIIEQYMNPRGATVLTLRCRSGSLNQRLIEKGAKVYGIDSFPINIRHATEVRGLPDILLSPMSRLHELAEAPPGLQFDCVAAMNEHVLGHVRSPRVLLARIYQVLKPGGYLFLEEKDVLSPARGWDMHVLDTGRAHLFHLTRHTVVEYVRSAGFEIVACAFDPVRATAFGHLKVIARRPHVKAAAVAAQGMPSGLAVLQQMQSIERSQQRRAWRRSVVAQARQSLKRVPGVLQAWRVGKRMLGR